MIDITVPEFDEEYELLEKIERFDPVRILHAAGRMGVELLSSSTPVDTGEAASSWTYKIEQNGHIYKLAWLNNAMAGRTPLVLLLQYGHATKSGHFLRGIDFINPALKPVYRYIDDRLKREALL